MSGRPVAVMLHGHRQTARVFSSRIGRLVKKLKTTMDVVFAEAPFELPLEEEQEVCMRTWYWRSTDPIAQGENYYGLKQSLAELRKIEEQHGPVHIVVGFSQGAILASILARLVSTGDARSPFPHLAAVVIAAGKAPREPLPDWLASCAIGALEQDGVKGVASLHVMGEGDQLISVEDSAALAACYTEPAAQLHRHSGGHALPSTAADMAVYEPFFANAAQAVIADKEEEQQDELEALAAMYFDGELTVECSEPGRVCVSIDIWKNMSIRARLPPGYPAIPPCVTVEHTMSMHEISPLVIEMINENIQEAIADNTDMPMVFAVATAAKQAMEDAEAQGMLSLDGDAMMAAKMAAAAAAHAEIDEEDAQAAQHNAYMEAMNMYAQHGDEHNEDGAWAANAAANAAAAADAAEAQTTRMVQAAALFAAQRAAELKGAGGEDHDSDGDDEDDWADPLVFGGNQGSDAPLSKGGVWNFCIGLVGKPSAGKSTFFNAVTQPASTKEEAAMAAHPFTTIDPNIGMGYVGAPCPCQYVQAVKPEMCKAQHGHLANGKRRVAIKIKDVAGLVPGAYKGRGKGNQFLHDLTEADVLVHVVDTSGRSNKEGVVEQSAKEVEEDGGHDPSEDVEWVREEIHRWIYGNISNKMHAVRRDPSKLPRLFSGYNANKALVWKALALAGVRATGNPKQALEEAVASWDSEEDLHKLVACFLTVRFPIVLACNKFDSASSRDNFALMQMKFPDQPMEPVCAAAEWWLQRMKRDGRVQYTDGDDGYEFRQQQQQDVDKDKAAGAVPAGAPDPDSKEGKAARHVAQIMGQMNGTGAARVMELALAQKAPHLCFPVADLDHLDTPGDGEPSTRLLRDVLLMKPGSTVDNVYSALLHSNQCRGDYVRAEGMDMAARKRKLLAKEGMLVDVDDHGSIVRVYTNKKISWQRRAREQLQQEEQEQLQLKEDDE